MKVGDTFKYDGEDVVITKEASLAEGCVGVRDSIDSAALLDFEHYGKGCSCLTEQDAIGALIIRSNI